MRHRRVPGTGLIASRCRLAFPPVWGGLPAQQGDRHGLRRGTEPGVLAREDAPRAAGRTQAASLRVLLAGVADPAQLLALARFTVMHRPITRGLWVVAFW